MDKIEEFLGDNLSDGIYLDGEAIGYQSHFKREFEAIGGDFELLIACCEDNIEIITFMSRGGLHRDCDENMEYDEAIRYDMVIMDYMKAINS
jgi:hypothetical protein